MLRTAYIILQYILYIYLGWILFCSMSTCSSWKPQDGRLDACLCSTDMPSWSLTPTDSARSHPTHTTESTDTLHHPSLCSTSFPSLCPTPFPHSAPPFSPSPINTKTFKLLISHTHCPPPPPLPSFSTTSLTVTYPCLQVKCDMVRIFLSHHHRTAGNDNNLKHVLAMERSLVQLLHQFNPIHRITLNLLHNFQSHDPPPTSPSAQTYSCLLLILCIKKCVVAQFKIAFPVLQVAGDGRSMASLEERAMVQN